MLTLSNTDAILQSLHFDGIERYLERPLNSHPDTFEWLFDPNLYELDCKSCAVASESGSYFAVRLRHSPCGCRQLEHRMREHSDKLQRWLQSSDDIFWVCGKAGSGKSTLMKFLFEHEQTRVHLDRWAHGDVTMAASFFWNAGSELEKSQLGLLRALLYQILYQHPESIQVVFPNRWKALLRSTQQKPWTEKELLIALELLSQAPTSDLRLFFLIDGLDEFSGDHQDLIESLQELNNSPAIKICVSSRPCVVFESAYGSNVHCSMELHELTVRDIDIYIATRLESLLYPGLLTGDELKTLGNEVRTRAKGVFLWVTLAIRDLRRGIGKRDSMFVLQTRLANYPSELDDFYQHILDNIDPVYRTFTGRLLLTMMSSVDLPELVCLHLWETYSCDTDNISDMHWRPKSGPEVHQLVKQGESCARNWVGDLIDPIPTHDILYCNSPDCCDCTVDVFIGKPCTSSSFSHRTVYQFVQRKADDGTLAHMAGPGFDPLLAGRYLYLGLSKYCTDPKGFAWLVYFALLRCHLPERFENADCPSIEPIIQIALAFDRTGQQITRPLHQNHWTMNQIYKNPRLPLDCQYSTLMSFMLNLNAKSEALVKMLLELQSRSITAGQRRFLLESAFISGLYMEHDDPGDHWPQNIVIELIKTLMDVNEPIRRVECIIDYSTWQIFLLWLHCELYYALSHENVDVVEIFQAFLSYGADPCAVVSGRSLEHPSYEDGCTLVRNTGLISATELLEDMKKHHRDLANHTKSGSATIECAQALLADAAQAPSQHP
jgi:hypothetical protein